MAENPYAAPRTHVQDARTSFPDGDFIADGRGVAAGNGWRWIVDAWTFTADQRLTFVGLFVLLLVVQLAANFLPVIGPLAVSLFTPVLVGGFVLGCEAVRRGEPLEISYFFAGFSRHTGKLVALGALSVAFGILAGVIMILIVGSAFLPILLGTAEPAPEEVLNLLLPMLLAVLVIMALSLPLSMAMLFATPLIVLENFEVGAALKSSFAACLKNVLPFLVWSVAILILGLLAAIPLLLGWFLLAPIVMVSLYLSYRDIFHDI
ncbi:MAG TPA: BPSS1780 family membrane protein [Gammaproteobacteria bacterium]|nr:BPSS1780 family membrane protein [Gammaproteobacteria bacterium]